MNLIFASQNPNKILEIQNKLPNLKIGGLDPAIFSKELTETGNTFEENALQKARQVYARTQKNCFADDSGLEVNALNNEPGIYSARYAGPQRNSEDNMNLLLANLVNKVDRSARFRTVIALIWEGNEFVFEGICEGEIITEKKGNEGFGYDPIFIPKGSKTTFAEMSMEEKSSMSHRGVALQKLVAFLSNLVQS